MSGHPTIAVIGAGLMGHGIAQVFARAGSTVNVFDAFEASLDTLRSRIEANLRDLGEPTDCVASVFGHADMAQALAGADYVFEAAPEKLEVKQAIFADLERLAPPSAVLASNTSVIPIGAIVGGLATRSRMLGTHWWNPPFLVPLVEVVGAADTDPAVVDSTFDLLAAVGKTPVRVLKDVPGFVGNRLQHALWREAIALVAEGICDARTVDMVVKASFGRRLGVLGPLENADLVGTDLTLDIHGTVIPTLDRTPGPSPYLRDLVEAGRLGMKSGEGFRTWTTQEAQDLRKRVFAHLKAWNAAESGNGGNDGSQSRGGA